MNNNQSKPMSEYSMKNWRNFGIYLILIGLMMLIFAGELKYHCFLFRNFGD